MRILIITNEVTIFHGWGLLGVEYGNFLKERGHQVEYYTKPKGNLSNPSFVTWPLLFYKKVIPRTRFYYIFHSLVINLLHLFRRYDAVIIVIEPLMPLAPRLLIKKKIQILAGTYSVVPWLDSKLKSLYQESVESIDQFCSISDYTSQKFITHSGVSSAKVATIPLGAHSQAIDHANEPRQNVFLFVGINKARKGLLFALQAFVEVLKHKPNMKYYIVGRCDPDSYNTQCKDFIEHNGLKDKVLFLGRVPNEELRRLYRTSLANVLTSVNAGDHFEGFGLIHVEANAEGTLTIGSRDCGNETAIKNGETGFLCRQKDVQDITHAMLEIIRINEAGEYPVYSEKCKQFAKSLSWKNYADKFVEICL
jgi:glycosyltransferase involved in cell wall biosynthesis